MMSFERRSFMWGLTTAEGQAYGRQLWKQVFNRWLVVLFVGISGFILATPYVVSLLSDTPVEQSFPDMLIISLSAGLAISIFKVLFQIIISIQLAYINRHGQQ
jgi:hypothetical protein